MGFFTPLNIFLRQEIECMQVKRSAIRFSFLCHALEHSEYIPTISRPLDEGDEDDCLHEDLRHA